MAPASEYFKDSPFGTYAGKLALGTGEDDFVPFKMHDELRRSLDTSFLLNPVTVRLLVSTPGGGKTWTLSWLSRYFTRKKDIMTIIVPRLELRGQPERGLVEAIFNALRPQLDGIRSKLQSGKFRLSDSLITTNAYYVWMALQDEEVFQIMSGGGGRLPALKGLAAPPLTKTEGTLHLLLGLFRVLYALNYSKVVVLVDEVESLFVAYGRKDLFIFSNFLRGLFDEFQSSAESSLPRLMMLLAGTTWVLEKISPALVGKQEAAGDVAGAFIRRMASPFELTPPDESDVLRLAEQRIEQHRSKAARPFIPYEKEAILYVWNNSFGIIGDFCHRLQQMYDLAAAEKAEKITEDHARRVLKELTTAVSSAED